MTDLLLVLGVGVAILFSALFSGAETGLYALSRLRLHFHLAQRSLGARQVEQLARDRQGLICTLLVGTNVTVYLASLLFQVLLQRGGYLQTELVSTLVLTPVLFIFAEAVPKNAFRIRSDPLFYQVAGLLVWLTALFKPVTVVIGALARRVTTWLGGAERPAEVLGRQALRTLFSHGEEEGLLSDYQRVMAANVVGLQETPVERVMVPIGEFLGFEVDTGRNEILAAGRHRPGTRALVFEGEPARVLGMVHLYDVLLQPEGRVDLRRLAREVPRFVPGTRLNVVLGHLTSRHQHVAVVERQGRALGVVTTKDVIEEIVGELKEL
ncbi:MAG: CNNM domain-containing protein [Planctomycetota bacterium]